MMLSPANQLVATAPATSNHQNPMLKRYQTLHNLFHTSNLTAAQKATLQTSLVNASYQPTETPPRHPDGTYNLDHPFASFFQAPTLEEKTESLRHAEAILVITHDNNYRLLRKPILSPDGLSGVGTCGHIDTVDTPVTYTFQVIDLISNVIALAPGALSLLMQPHHVDEGSAFDGRIPKGTKFKLQKTPTSLPNPDGWPGYHSASDTPDAVELHDLEGFFGSIPTIAILDAPPTFPPEGTLDDDDFISNLDGQHPFLHYLVAAWRYLYEHTKGTSLHIENPILPVKHKYVKWLVENAIIPTKPQQTSSLHTNETAPSVLHTTAKTKWLTLLCQTMADWIHKSASNRAIYESTLDNISNDPLAEFYPSTKTTNPDNLNATGAGDEDTPHPQTTTPTMLPLLTPPIPRKKILILPPLPHLAPPAPN